VHLTAGLRHLACRRLDPRLRARRDTDPTVLGQQRLGNSPAEPSAGGGDQGALAPQAQLRDPMLEPWPRHRAEQQRLLLHRLVDDLAEGSLVEAEVAHWGCCWVDPITRRGSAVTDRSGSPRCRCVSQPTGRISGRVRAPVHVVVEDDHDAPWATRSLPVARRPRRTDAADRAGPAARTWLLASGPASGKPLVADSVVVRPLPHVRVRPDV
jgi:hypothetical protein